MVTVSILSIVILIFVLHTVLTHLLNWAFRKTMDSEVGVGIFILNLIEIVIMVILLKNFIQ
jgi:hypothetical protein